MEGSGLVSCRALVLSEEQKTAESGLTVPGPPALRRLGNWNHSEPGYPQTMPGQGPGCWGYSQAGRGLVVELEDLESPRDLQWGIEGTRAASGSLFEGWVKVRRSLSG